jgi:hypothetical protein
VPIELVDVRSSDPRFDAAGSFAVIEPGGFRSLAVVFRPSQEGEARGDLTLQFGPPSHAVVVLRLAGFGRPVTP